MSSSGSKDDDATKAIITSMVIKLIVMTTLSDIQMDVSDQDHGRFVF